jgi:hypothetical protein
METFFANSHTRKNALKKTLIFNLILFLSPLVAGLYGILHDQLTYTISPEYYTKFKFIQFGLIDKGEEALIADPRISVTCVGFLATWWTGIFVGLGHAIASLIHKDNKIMWRMACKGTLVTLLVTLLFGLLGLTYGKFYLTETGVNWWLPDNLIDKENFIAVGSMHNFSYLGGLFGLIAGIAHQLVQRRKESK